MKKVTVLMSTYNGSQFLQQQLDSLYQQTYPHIKIIVRDDGSSDNTRDLLVSEASQGRIALLAGHDNLGPTASFFMLLQYAAQMDTDYIAFCDQDDVWQVDKIDAAISALISFEDRPALYCCRLEFVNDELQFLALSHLPRKVGFGNALVENIAVGCTMVLNRQAIDLLCKQALPHEVYIHDWWCYLVISCFGVVVFDQQAFIKYRQHSANAIGAATSHLAVLKRKFARFLYGRLWISEQAVVFLRLFENQLPQPEYALVQQLIKAKSSFFARVQFAFSKQVWRQKRIDNMILRLVILMNRI